jgi:hypothetical protein
MEALTAKAALVDPATLDADGGSAVTTTIPRTEIEEAARLDGPSELFLDVARVRDVEHREVEAEQRVTVSWEPDDLEKLLRSTTADQITLAFKSDELARIFDDVEAHGLRGKLAVLTVVATAGAGIAAGAATASVYGGSESGGGTASSTPAFVTDTTSSGPSAAVQSSGAAQFVTDTTSSAQGSGSDQIVTDTTSSGPSRAADAAVVGDGHFVTDATSSGAGAYGTNVQAASGGSDSFIESTGGEAALAGGIALLILGAGFLGTRQRRGGVQPA